MGAVLPAVALYVFVSIFSEGAASNARWKILFIAIGSAAVSTVVRQLIQGVAGPLVASAAALGLIVATLIFWCGIGRKAALKIAAAYFLFSIAIKIVATYLGVVVTAG